MILSMFKICFLNDDFELAHKRISVVSKTLALLLWCLKSDSLKLIFTSLLVEICKKA